MESKVNPDKNIKVLAVEEDRIIRKIFQRTLESRFHLDLAKNNPEALNILAENNIHVLISDLRLPGTEGMELCRQARKFFPFMEIIATGTDPDPEDFRQEIDEIRACYKSKPFSIKDILKTIDSAARRIKATENFLLAEKRKHPRFCVDPAQFKVLLNDRIKGCDYFLNMHNLSSGGIGFSSSTARPFKRKTNAPLMFYIFDKKTGSLFRVHGELAWLQQNAEDMHSGGICLIQPPDQIAKNYNAILKNLLLHC